MGVYAGAMFLAIAITGVGMLPALFIGLGGFVAGGTMVLPSRLSPEFHYFIYYINPVSWFIRSAMINEFGDARYSGLLVSREKKRGNSIWGFLM